MKRAFERRGDELVDRASECRGVVVVPVRLFLADVGSNATRANQSAPDLDSIASGNPLGISQLPISAYNRELRNAVASGLLRATLADSRPYVSALAKCGGLRAVPSLNEHLKRVLAMSGSTNPDGNEDRSRAVRLACRAILALSPDHTVAARRLCGMTEEAGGDRSLVVRDLVRVWRPGMLTEAMSLVRQTILATLAWDDDSFVGAIPVLLRLDPLTARRRVRVLLEHGVPQQRYALMQQLVQCDMPVSDIVTAQLALECSIEIRLLGLRSAPGCVRDPRGVLEDALAHESPAVRWEARTALRTYPGVLREDEMSALLSDEPDEFLQSYGVSPRPVR